MAKQVAVVVIHGIGSQDPQFSEPLRKEICNRLKANAANTHWEEIYWADVLQAREDAYLRRANRDNDLDFFRVRTLLYGAFGDAAAYRKPADARNTTYDEIHARVALAVDRLNAVVPPKTPLIVLAHSLGGHIMSNYIWDMQKKGAGAGLNDFQRMRTHAGMITFGCNIPFFTLAFKEEDIEPIDFPGKALKPEDKKKAQWLNFFDPDDILGYPLKPINDAYRKVVARDVTINVGGLLTSWNPASHSKYWTDDDFTRPVASFIAKFL